MISSESWPEKETIIYENERAWIGGGFSKSGLLPNDRGRYCTSDGSLYWKTLDEAQEALQEKGWTYSNIDDTDDDDNNKALFLPHNAENGDNSNNGGSGDNPDNYYGWHYCRDFTQGAIDNAKPKRNPALHWVRFRRLSQQRYFDPEQFLPPQIFKRCDNIDSQAKKKLSTFFIESLAYLSMIYDCNNLTEAMALSLKKEFIDLIGIGTPEAKVSTTDVFANMESIQSKLLSHADSQRKLLKHSLSLFATVPFRDRYNKARAPGYESRCTAISSAPLLFCPGELDALVTLLLKFVDDEIFQIHCDEENCGAGCPFAAVPCPNGGCAVVISRKHLSSHDEMCLFKTIPCPLGCGDTFLRKDEDKHMTTVCGLRKVACPFSHIGCIVVKTARDMPQHVADSKESHLMLSLTKLGTLETALGQLTARVTALEAENLLLKSTVEENKADAKKTLKDLESRLTKVTKKVDNVDSANKKEFKKVWKHTKDLQNEQTKLGKAIS